MTKIAALSRYSYRHVGTMTYEVRDGEQLLGTVARSREGWMIRPTNGREREVYRVSRDVAAGALRAEVEQIRTRAEHFRGQFPAASGEVVTEGHANACREFGHASWIVDGVSVGRCSRCGEVTGTLPVAAAVATTAEALAHPERDSRESDRAHVVTTWRLVDGERVDTGYRARVIDEAGARFVGPRRDVRAVAVDDLPLPRRTAAERTREAAARQTSEEAEAAPEFDEGDPSTWTADNLPEGASWREIGYGELHLFAADGRDLSRAWENARRAADAEARVAVADVSRRLLIEHTAEQHPGLEAFDRFDGVGTYCGYCATSVQVMHQNAARARLTAALVELDTRAQTAGELAEIAPVYGAEANAYAEAARLIRESLSE